jgi:hypothetical protein
MNYVDSTIVRLADPATRPQVFDSDSLDQLLRTAYDTDQMNVQAPFSTVFEEFRLGLAVPRLGILEGNWNPIGGMERMEARFQLSGVGSASTIRVDAFWRGAIIARASMANGFISAVRTAWPDTGGIDEEIIAALGALPADPAVLEQERRTRFVNRLKAVLDQPGVLTAAAMDQLLQQMGASSVGDLMQRLRGVGLTGAMQVTFTQPALPPLSPKPLPISAAILIRDSGFSLADLLVDSKIAREQLEPLGLSRPEDPSLRMRQPLLVVWIVPQAVFSDAGWPGATVATRRAAAGDWLAREGIGLVVTN